MILHKIIQFDFDDLNVTVKRIIFIRKEGTI